MRVWLTSGKFESQISIPLMCTSEEREKFTAAWFELMSAGVRLGSKL